MEGGKNAVGLFWGEVLRLLAEVLFLHQGVEEGEEGIDGGVVEVLARGIVDHAHVGGRFAHTAADGEEEEGAHHNEHASHERAVGRGEARERSGRRIETEQEARIAPNEEAEHHHGSQEKPEVQTFGDARGVVEIREADGIEFEPPFAI